jgi:nitrogen fixation protein NifU and related proteins
MVGYNILYIYPFFLNSYLKIIMYTDKVLAHFKNPHNQGEMKDANAVGQEGNPVCGDVMKIYLKIENNIIQDVKFETLGCAAAIAVSSDLTDMVKGKTLEEALKITKDDVVKDLGGLPPVKVHCSMLGVDALHKAIENYKNNK